MTFGSGSLFGGKKHGAFGSGGSEEFGSISLNLTALMDILSNLLFFLLASYAATNTEIKGADNMQLPSSTSQTEAQMSILVRVTLDVIEVEGKPVAKIQNGVITGDDGDKIVPMFNELTHIAQIGKKGVKMDEDNTVLLVLADKRADYQTVSKALKTAGYAGFPNFRFAVLKR